MVSCSTQKKPTCGPPDCLWTVGKGCSKIAKVKSPKATKAAKAPKAAKKTNKVAKAPKQVAKKVSMSSLQGHVIVFSGFRSDELKKELESKGAVVKSAISGKTTLIVFVETSKNKDKMAELQKAHKTMKLPAFLKKFSLSSNVAADAPKAAKGVKKAKMPRASKAAKRVARAPGSIRMFVDRNGNTLDAVDLPVYGSNIVEYKYKGISIQSLIDTSQKIAMGMYGRQEIRKMYDALFYCPKHDIFMILTRVTNEESIRERKTNPKAKARFDYIGLEFTVAPPGNKQRFIFSEDFPTFAMGHSIDDLHIRLKSGHSALDIYKLLPEIKANYGNDVVIVGTRDKVLEFKQ